MDPAKLLKYDQRVPRYTSYPTAVQFDPSVGPEQHGRWLQRVGPEQSVSVYLHVPFCNELCWYCGCNTQVGRHDSTFGNYTDLLCREIDMAAEFFSSRPKVTWVHWGGGTPSSIGVDRMARIMAAVQRHCDLLDGAEVAVELDPRVLSLDELARLPRELGVNRASIGVQDFNPRVQAAINRTQPYDLVAAVVARIREEGIADLNLDLMYGLPHQRREDFGDTVDQAITLRPERMTLFGYAHVPWMFSHQNLIKEADLPDGDERLALFDEALRRLEAAGYVHIGLDHFAHPDSELAQAQREGRMHRNFQGYTTDPAPTLLAFGASAISTLPDGFVQNLSAARDYMAAIGESHLATARGVALSDDDRLRARIIERLMCDFEIDLEAICGQFGAEVAQFAPDLERLAPLIDDDLVAVDGWKVRVLDEGRMLVRAACVAFDRYHAPDPERPAHARAI